MHKKLEYGGFANTTSHSPGPGAYAIHLSHKKKAPAYKLGTEKRDNSSSPGRHSSPSANKYFPNMTFTQTSAAKWGFGSEKRQSLARTLQSPGPGNYELKSAAFEQRDKARFFMGIKLEEAKEKISAPAPGAYNPDYTKVVRNLPRFSMKKKLNNGEFKSISPGPVYEVHLKNKQAAPRFGFGTSTRDNKDMNTISPGPGAYKINVKVGEVPAYAIPNKPDTQKYV